MPRLFRVSTRDRPVPSSRMPARAATDARRRPSRAVAASLGIYGLGGVCRRTTPHHHFAILGYYSSPVKRKDARRRAPVPPSPLAWCAAGRRSPATGIFRKAASLGRSPARQGNDGFSGTPSTRELTGRDRKRESSVGRERAAGPLAAATASLLAGGRLLLDRHLRA